MVGDTLCTARDGGKTVWVGMIYGGVGYCYQKLFDQGLSIFKELGDRAGQSATLHNLGVCYLSIGQYAKAMELFEQALVIDKDLGDRVEQVSNVSC